MTGRRLQAAENRGNAVRKDRKSKGEEYRISKGEEREERKGRVERSDKSVGGKDERRWRV